MKKLTTKNIRKLKSSNLQMLTCYDYQMATLLDQTDLDMILVGDSVGNVVLGFDTTVEVNLDHMKMFGLAVRKGAPNKFLIIDMPFGTYSTLEEGLKNAISLFQETRADAIKIEASNKTNNQLIERLVQIGIPVMGHIGLTPQLIHEMGGYFKHGKTQNEAEVLLNSALELEKSGCFSIVLECIDEKVSELITSSLAIPTIGIGSGIKVDGQVLVINDLLKNGADNPPSFCRPMIDLFDIKKEVITSYIDLQKGRDESKSEFIHN